MAIGTLTGQTIANTYKSLLKITGTTAGGETLHATNQIVIEDGDGNPFPFSAAQNHLMMTGTAQLQFGDTGTYIHQSADGVLDLVSDSEVEISGALIDINSTGAMTLDVADDSNITVAGSNKDLSIAVSGGSTQTLTISSAGTGANAIGLTASAGGITVGLGGGAGDDFIVDTTTLVVESDNNRVGIGTAAPTTILQISLDTNDTGGDILPNIGATFLGLGGSNFQATSYGVIGFGYNAGASDDEYPCSIGYLETSNTEYTKGALVFHTRNTDGRIARAAERMRIGADGNVGIGTTLPNTLLELDQGAGDDAIITCTSSDVAHGMTDKIATDSFAHIKKLNATEGGLLVGGYSETSSAITLEGSITTDTATRSTSGIAPVYINGLLKSSATVGAQASDKNICAIGNNGTTQFIFDTDGDSHQNVGTAWTNFDNEHDAMITRSLGVFMSPETAIKTKWDDWGRDHKEDLIRCGIMPKLTKEEEENGDRPLVNTTQVMRLHNGAIWQQYTEMQKMKELMYETMIEFMGKEKADKKLDNHDIKLLDKELLN